MNILTIMNTCARGGAENLVFDIISNDKLNRHYFITFRGGVMEGLIKKVSYRYIVFNGKHKIDVKKVIKLRKLVKNNEIDLIHTHIIIDALYAYLATIKLKIKRIHTFHGYSETFTQKVITFFLAKRMYCFYFVSNELKKYFIKKYRFKNYKVVLNGVDAKKIKKKYNLRSELKISDKQTVFAMVGNFINSGRDQLTICYALNALSKKNLNYIFLFIGRSDTANSIYFDEVKYYIENNNLSDKVFLLGERSDVYEILPQLDAYVYSSNHDSFGLTLIEAMLSKIPIFINDLEVFKSISKDGLYAHLFPTKNFKVLSFLLEDFIRKPDRYKKNINIAYKHALENFSIERVIKEYYDFKGNDI